MRSQDVFAANRKLVNRFRLCAIVGKGARVLQTPNTHGPQAIGEAFRIIAAGPMNNAPVTSFYTSFERRPIVSYASAPLSALSASDLYR